MLRTKLLALALCVFLLSVSLPAPVAKAANISIYVDGKLIQPDVQPYLQSDRVMVPLRFISEAFGFRVNYAPQAEYPVQIYPVLAGINSKLRGVADDFGFFALRPGDKGMQFRARIFAGAGQTVTTGQFKNGKFVGGEVATELKNGRVFVPLRMVAEAFGCRVDWDAAKGAVRVGKYSKDTILTYHPDLSRWAYVDLSIAKLEANPGSIRAFLVGVSSKDYNYFENVPVKFYIDGEYAGESEQILVTKMTYFGAAAKAPKNGAHKVKAVIDPDGKFWDCDTSNNTIERAIDFDGEN